MKISCKEASRLMSSAFDRPLSFWERICLRVHLSICDMCRAYKRQLEVLSHAIKTLLPK
jgi:hypothetical protein